MLATVEPDDRTLRLERRLPAAPERVFAAWTDVGQLAEWFGPAGSEVLDCRLDPRAGGDWALSMRVRTGRVYAVSGRYLEVEPPRLLSFTWAWHEDGTLETPRESETVVTIRLEPAGAGTLLQLTQTRFRDAAGCASHGEGWGETLDTLGRFLDVSPDRRRSA